MVRSSQHWEDHQQFSFLAVGDYGGEGDGQYPVAAMLDVYKARVSADLVVGLGDNFYDHKLTPANDPQYWYQNWYQVYRKYSINMKDVPWHAILGNHDYCGYARAQIENKRDGWRMDSFHWVHRFYAGEQHFAFVYIDTNLLAYGLDTKEWLKRTCPNMRKDFQEFAEDPEMRWSQDEHIKQIGELLDSVQDAAWIVVFGHHPVGGGPCGGEGRLSELMPLFETKRVSAYFYGHVHALSHAIWKDVSYVMSGSGSDRFGKLCTEGGAGTVWGKEKTLGFVWVKFFNNRMQMTYVDGEGNQVFTAAQWRR